MHGEDMRAGGSRPLRADGVLQKPGYHHPLEKHLQNRGGHYSGGSRSRRLRAGIRGKKTVQSGTDVYKRQFAYTAKTAGNKPAETKKAEVKPAAETKKVETKTTVKKTTAKKTEPKKTAAKTTTAKKTTAKKTAAKKTAVKKENNLYAVSYTHLFRIISLKYRSNMCLLTLTIFPIL